MRVRVRVRVRVRLRLRLRLRVRVRQLRLPGLREGLGVLDDRVSQLGIARGRHASERWAQVACAAQGTLPGAVAHLAKLVDVREARRATPRAAPE